MNAILQKRIEEAAEKHEQCYNVGEEHGYLYTHKGDIKEAVIYGATFALQNQWISVEEALPEEKFDNGYEFVFVIVKIDEETSYYDTDYIRNGKWELHDADEVTHWMPISQLKGGKDE